MTNPIELTAAKTALVVIDLQAGILARPCAPHASADVLDRSVAMCSRFRAAGGHVVLVRVSFAADESDVLSQPCDEPTPRGDPPGGTSCRRRSGPERATSTSRSTSGVRSMERSSICSSRRRGVTTLVMCGISTNFGVESTAREAWERNYALIFAEDAMTSANADAHAFAVKTIFPRLGRVRSTSDVLAGLT